MSEVMEDEIQHWKDNGARFTFQPPEKQEARQ